MFEISHIYIIIYNYCLYCIISSWIKVLSQKAAVVDHQERCLFSFTVLLILRTACACGKSDLNTLQLVRMV